MKRETMMFRKTLRRLIKNLRLQRDIGQHENFMGGKNPEVLAHKNDEFVAVKDLEFTAVHLLGGLFAQGFQL